jgi:MYXO-CTERM domain-containing protein
MEDTRTHPLLAQPPLRSAPAPAMNPEDKPKFVYDARVDWGAAMLGVAGLLVMLGGFFAYQAHADADGSPSPDYSGALGLVGVAAFFVLIGVILIAGAQVVGVSVKTPKRKRG